jgi:hypothetical protein
MSTAQQERMPRAGDESSWADEKLPLRTRKELLREELREVMKRDRARAARAADVSGCEVDHARTGIRRG